MTSILCLPTACRNPTHGPHAHTMESFSRCSTHTNKSCIMVYSFISSFMLSLSLSVFYKVLIDYLLSLISARYAILDYRFSLHSNAFLELLLCTISVMTVNWSLLADKTYANFNDARVSLGR